MKRISHSVSTEWPKKNIRKISVKFNLGEFSPKQNSKGKFYLDNMLFFICVLHNVLWCHKQQQKTNRKNERLLYLDKMAIYRIRGFVQKAKSHKGQWIFRGWLFISTKCKCSFFAGAYNYGKFFFSVCCKKMPCYVDKMVTFVQRKCSFGWFVSCSNRAPKSAILSK